MSLPIWLPSRTVRSLPSAEQRAPTSTTPQLTMIRRLRALVIQGVIIVLLTIGLLEALVVFSLRNPAAAVIPMDVLKPLHVLFDRNTIQVMPECAIYDEGLTYTLRPGRCTFANREFSNQYSINSLGVRDDEGSLAQPRVVMIGDSITMGWGVEQDESFASVFERRTGWRTLNAGVSSYGTVRELRMLERIDRSAVTDIVLQYSANDVVENRELIAGRFKTLSQQAYESTVQAQADMLRYFPGKHALNLLVMLRNLVQGRATSPPPPTPAEQAAMLLTVLEQSPVDLSPYRVTVFSLEPGFIDAVRPLAGAAAHPVIQRLRFVDGSGLASTPGAFYVLDDHPTRVGHEQVARMLSEALAGGS